MFEKYSILFFFSLKASLMFQVFSSNIMYKTFNVTIVLPFFQCLSSSCSVQCPQLAPTLHWRASTTVTRVLGSHSTDFATSQGTVRWVTTKVPNVVSITIPQRINCLKVI